MNFILVFIFVLKLEKEDKEEKDESFVQEKGYEPRQLTPNELTKLAKDTQLVNDFKQNKIELDAKKCLKNNKIV